MPQNGPEYSHRNPGFSGHHDDRKHRGLLSWLVSLSSSVAELTMGLGERLLAGEVGGGGEGAAKAWYCPLVLLWEIQCTPHVCLRFVMSNSFNVHVWGPFANESIPLKHVLGWGRGESVALNSLLRTCSSLKHTLSCTAFKQLECMDKSRVSFWCFFAKQEPRRESP